MTTTAITYTDYHRAPAGRRGTRKEVAELKRAIADLSRESRTFQAVQELAARFHLSGQHAWRIANVLGCPMRNVLRPSKKISLQQVLLAQDRVAEGETISAVARDFGISASGLHNRLSSLANKPSEPLRDPRCQPPAKPRVYTSDFIRPFALSQLTAGRARPAPYTRDRT